MRGLARVHPLTSLPLAGRGTRLKGNTRWTCTPHALVSTEWLAARLDAPDVRIVDGSFYLPAQKRDPKAEFVEQHIPGRGVLRHRRDR